MTKPKMTHKERAERRAKIVEELRLAKKTTTELALEYGMSVPSVCALRPHDVPLVRRVCGPGLYLSTYKIIARILNTNDSYSAIAADFYCSHQFIHQVAGKMKDAGINFPERSQHPA